MRSRDCGNPLHERGPRLACAIVFVLFASLSGALLPSVPARASGSISALTVDSQPGDWVGSGHTFAFTPADSNISFTGTTAAAALYARSKDGQHWFYVFLAAPVGESFAPGESFPTLRFADATHGRLDVSGDGHGCNMDTGTLAILEVDADDQGNLIGFAARYVQHCEGDPPALFGEIRFDASTDFKAAAADPDRVVFSDQMVHTSSPPQTISVTNEGSTTVTLGSGALDGPNATEFSLSNDLCSNTQLAAGASCSLEVTFTPSDMGDRVATLHVPDDTYRGEREIPLSGNGIKVPSSVGLVSSASVVTYGRSVTLTAHLDQYQESSNKSLSIYVTPYDGSKTLIATGTVDGGGNFAARYAPKNNSTFVADFAGDDKYAPSESSPVTVNVRVIVRSALKNYYGQSGKYKLYHYTPKCPRYGQGCPVVTGWTIPNHRGRPLSFRIQEYYSGRWHTTDVFFYPIGRKGSVTVVLVYGGPGVKFHPFRIRTEFKGDADHLGGISGWAYFKVTN